MSLAGIQTPTFFSSLAKCGVKVVVVKLTEGTTCKNSKAKAQIRAAWNTDMRAHGYHLA